MKKRLCILSFCLLFLLLAAVCSAYADDLPSNYSKALKYVKNNQPTEAVATNVGWNPQQLTDIRNALPEGAVFHFTCKWNGVTFSDESEALDLTKAKKDLNDNTFRLLLALCPNVKSVDNSTNKLPSNDTFIPLMEEHPEIHLDCSSPRRTLLPYQRYRLQHAESHGLWHPSEILRSGTAAVYSRPESPGCGT